MDYNIEHISPSLGQSLISVGVQKERESEREEKREKESKRVVYYQNLFPIIL